jgi:TolA-binding protein
VRFCRSVLALSLVLACGPGKPSAFALSYAAAERAESAGRYEEAAQAYAAAAADPNAPPREQDHARLSSALVTAKAGDRAGAATQLRALAAGNSEVAGPAEFHLAVLLLESGDPTGWDALDHFLHAYPNTGLGLVAFRRRLRHEDEGGPAQALAWLRAMAPGVAGSDLEEYVAYFTAERLADTGQTAEALAAFQDVATRFPYPKAHFDDALYRASELAEAQGKPQDAVALLERMLAAREISSLPGTYNRPRFPDGTFRIAVLWRDKLGNPAKARDAFLRFVDDYPDSTKVDDALWEATKLAENDDARCALLARLLRSAPDSRYVPCVVERCKDLKRPAESHAPKDCHGYLEKRD